MTAVQQYSNMFYIQTGMSGWLGEIANPYVLSNNSGIVIDPWQPGNPAQIWLMNPDGSLRPMNDSTVVLTAPATTSSQVTLESPEGTNDSLSAGQLWTYTGNKLSVDMGGSIGQVYLNVYGGNLAAGAAVITYENTSGSNEVWYLIPAQPLCAGEWFYLRTDMPNDSGDNKSVYVMAVTEVPLYAGAQVTIEPWAPGSASQLWKMTDGGMIVNALNLDLCLSSTLSGHDITMQSIGNSGYWSNWGMMTNNAIAGGNPEQLFFLNVNGSRASGTYLSSNCYNGNNLAWTPLPYEPEGLWFTIESAAPQSDLLNELLTVTLEGDITTAPPMGGFITPTLQGAKYQLWRKTIDGYILSATHPSLALTAGSDGSLSLALLEANNLFQQWYSNYSELEKENGASNYNALIGTLENIGSGQLLTTSGLANAPSGGTYTNEALWSIIPYAMPFGESTTIRNLGGGVSGLFMTLPEPAKPGDPYQIVVDAIPENAAFSTWQYVYPGYIVSGANPEIVLSLEVDTSGTLDNPKYQSNVVVYPRQSKIQLFQLWTITSNGQIVNQYNYQALTITAASLKASVTTQSVNITDPATGNQIWDFSVGKALQTAMAQPRLPYPSYKGNAAYIYICQQLGVADIRTQYVNLTAPIPGYLAQLNNMSYKYLHGGTLPEGTTLSEFTEIIPQLIREMTAVSAVQALFQQATTLYLSLSQAQVMALSELITACALPESVNIPAPKKKKSWIGDLVEGILYTGLNIAGTLIPDPGADQQFSTADGLLKNGLPVFANIMATVFATYEGVTQTTSTGATALQKAEVKAFNYEMTVSQLQQHLLTEFENVGTALGNVATFILSNWGTTRAVYTMTSNTTDMSSLFWPSNLTAKDVRKMLNNYILGVLKTLMPANAGYSIHTFMHINYNQLKNKGWGGNYYMDNADGTQNEYSANGVPQQVMNIAWANGMDTKSFFTGINGWNLQTQYQGIMGNGASCLVNIINCTNVPLTVKLNLQNLVGSDYSANNGTGANIPVAPYGDAQIAGLSVPVVNTLNGGGQADSWYGAALCTNKKPGVSILNGSDQIISFDIENSYANQTSYKKISDIPDCTYTTPNQTLYSNFNCIITQRIGPPSNMVYIDVIVSAD